MHKTGAGGKTCQLHWVSQCGTLTEDLEIANQQVCNLQTVLQCVIQAGALVRILEIHWFMFKLQMSATRMPLLIFISLSEIHCLNAFWFPSEPIEIIWERSRSSCLASNYSQEFQKLWITCFFGNQKPET